MQKFDYFLQSLQLTDHVVVDHPLYKIVWNELMLHPAAVLHKNQYLDRIDDRRKNLNYNNQSWYI